MRQTALRDKYLSFLTSVTDIICAPRIFSSVPCEKQKKDCDLAVLE